MAGRRSWEGTTNDRVLCRALVVVIAVGFVSTVVLALAALAWLLDSFTDDRDHDTRWLR